MVHLVGSNTDVKQHNAKCFKSLDQPIVYVHAKHSGNRSTFSVDMAMISDLDLFLYVGAKVLIMQNVRTITSYLQWLYWDC